MPGQAVVHLLAVGANRRKAADRVEFRIAVELEGVAGEPVGARLRDRAHRGAGPHAVLGVGAARGDAELLHRVGKRQRETGSVLGVVVQRAVQQIRHTERQPAGDGDVHATLEAAVVRPSHVDRGARLEDQVGDLASLQRQLDNALLLDDLADACALRVHERRRRLDGNRLGQLAQSKGDVDRRRRGHLQDDARLDIGAEAREHDLEPVRPDGQVRQDVRPAVVGHGGPRETGIRLNDGHGDSWQHAAAVIRHPAAQLCGRLSVGNRARQEQHHYANRATSQNTTHTLS